MLPLPTSHVCFFSWNLLFICHLDYCHVRGKLHKSIHEMRNPLLFRIYWVHLEKTSSVLNKATHPSKSLNYVPVKQNIRERVYIYTLFIWVHLGYKSPQSPLRVLGSLFWIILKPFFFRCFREAWFGICTHNVVVLFNFVPKNILWLNTRLQSNFKRRPWLH